MGNTFGNLFKLTSFGESHGSMIGGIIEGCPAGLEINKGLIQKDLDRRKPGQSKVTSPRKEDDKVQLLSGIFEGKSTGTPIGFLIPNINSKSQDYSNIKDVFRPSHADYTYEEKYGLRDYRGGGRSSARETACRVVAGSIAKQLLNNYGLYNDGGLILGESCICPRYQLWLCESSPVNHPNSGRGNNSLADRNKYTH